MGIAGGDQFPHGGVEIRTVELGRHPHRVGEVVVTEPADIDPLDRDDRVDVSDAGRRLD